MKRDQSPLDNVRTHSRPSRLRITDIRFARIVGAPMPCILMKVYTNQDIVGFGEVRDGSSGLYAAMLKGRLLGENPCDVDRLFRRIKQFGGHGRHGGGVSGIEVALWDLAGKAYSVPVCQMLGGRFRERVRIYCDTDSGGRPTGADMGLALKKRMEKGFTFLKMDLGMGQLSGHRGAVSQPLGLDEEAGELSEAYSRALAAGPRADSESRWYRARLYDLSNRLNPLTGIHITEKGLDILEQYVAEVREAIGYEVPLATDHFGPFGVEDAERLLARLSKYSLAWFEDPIPWQLTEQYTRLSRSTHVPLCTGEDVYLSESFRPLVEANAVSVVHPDVLTAGGVLETRKIGDMAQERGIAMAIHMAESPIGCMAAAHAAVSSENFLALEFHSTDVPWWEDLVSGPPKPIVNRGFLTVPDSPGLGIESLNDQVIREHLDPAAPGLWEPTDRWDEEWCHDRTWS